MGAFGGRDPGGPSQDRCTRLSVVPSPSMRSRVAVQALLAGRSHDYPRLARPLLRSLELSHHFDVEVITDPGALDSGRSRVILAATAQPLGPGQAEALTALVRAGRRPV